MEQYIEKLKSDKKEMELVLETKYPKRLDPQSEEAKASGPTSPEEVALEAIAKMKFEAITKYGWDQTETKVKVYLTSGLEGLKDLPKDQVSCEFEDKSFDLRI